MKCIWDINRIRITIDKFKKLHQDVPLVFYIKGREDCIIKAELKDTIEYNIEPNDLLTKQI
jgi:hypothetical protein